MKHKSVAFIPARSGSKRVKDKNIRSIDGHPLLAYSIISALESNIFDSVICATDSQEYADIALYYGADVPFLRPESISGDKSPDIDWVKLMLKNLKEIGREYDIFSILRPTSPFRTSDEIKRAWEKFINNKECDSLRAVEKCKTHPGKMWTISNNRMFPILPFMDNKNPWHSSQYGALPEVYSQNASLEIAWTNIALLNNSIAGGSIIPFISSGLNGFDINEEQDWLLAENYIDNLGVKLPLILKKPYNTTQIIKD